MARRTNAPETIGSEARGETIDEHFGALRKGWSDEEGLWPPTVFALCASLLSATGQYVEIIASARPSGRWPKLAKDIGRAWEESIRLQQAPPSRVLQMWGRLLASANMAVGLLALAKSKTTLGPAALLQARQVLHALFELIGYADEACAGIGMETPAGWTHSKSSRHWLTERGRSNLLRYGTLSPDIPVSRCRVLPKQHTPDVGLTVRSLTHHLALHAYSEVAVRWRTVPRLTKKKKMSLLLAPWPLTIRPTDFRPAATGGPGFSNCFEYQPGRSTRGVRAWLQQLHQRAKEQSGPIDAIVFPELALSESEFDDIARYARSEDVMLIAGVRGSNDANEPVNVVRIEPSFPFAKPLTQAKHHRWKLECSQITNYGLAGVLDPSQDWWEATYPESRGVQFLALNSELTFCCLICEDLARQEPVASLVRTVGPNLVIALLMDGPQLEGRWSSRYATALADDPGCSVLSFTSLGMVKLSRPSGSQPSHPVVALWKDKGRQTQEITMPKDADGLVIHLGIENVTEFTADGRSDEGVSSVPRFRGSYPISLGAAGPASRSSRQ